MCIYCGINASQWALLKTLFYLYFLFRRTTWIRQKKIIFFSMVYGNEIIIQTNLFMSHIAIKLFYFYSTMFYCWWRIQNMLMTLEKDWKHVIYKCELNSPIHRTLLFRNMIYTHAYNLYSIRCVCKKNRQIL